MFVNVVIALVIDVVFSFLFFLEGFIIYFQFYLSGKLFVDSLKSLDIDDEEDNNQFELPQTGKTSVNNLVAKEPAKQSRIESYESTIDNLNKLDELLESGVITNEEYIEEKKNIASYAYRSAKQKNNKTMILRSLKLLLDLSIITSEEYKKQKKSTLSVVSIPWDKDKSKYEILEEMQSLFDDNILTEEEFSFHEKQLLLNNTNCINDPTILSEKLSYESAIDRLDNLDELLETGVLTEKAYDEQRKKIVFLTFLTAESENNKIPILKSLKLLLDIKVLTPEEYYRQKQLTLGDYTIPWDQSKSKIEILEEMKSLFGANMLTQEEFLFYKKQLFPNKTNL